MHFAGFFTVFVFMLCAYFSLTVCSMFCIILSELLFPNSLPPTVHNTRIWYTHQDDAESKRRAARSVASYVQACDAVLTPYAESLYLKETSGPTGARGGAGRREAVEVGSEGGWADRGGAGDMVRESSCR